ncbi:MAG: hypothetical protein J3K34DRAFT_458946 [Monoraphidium minutum]|nr:MAG: hypothetical protein J3K34DRAFT_458946 [Monoraphidium minutum]
MQTISSGLCRARGLPCLAPRQTFRLSASSGRLHGAGSSSSSGAAAAASSSVSRATGGSSGARRGRAPLVCRAADERQPNVGKGAADLSRSFNPVYFAIVGVYAGLLVLRNPYIYAVLTILTVLPQNSNVTSLNNLVLLFYESGLFQNFAEAVTCVRLVTWLSMGFMVLSFSLTYA